MLNFRKQSLNTIFQPLSYKLCKMEKTTNFLLRVLLAYLALFVSNEKIKVKESHRANFTFAEIVSKSTIDQNKRIKAISYNVWGLPVWLPGQNQSQRFRQISDSIQSRDFEVICLQEVFNTKLREQLIDKLLPNYFTASDYKCNQKVIGKLIQKDCNGGLMTLSKYPIINEQFYKYSYVKDCSLIEKIGGKGFLFTTILWNGQPINIINTHLYAGENDNADISRLYQLKEMHNILQDLESYQKYPSLLFGDLNISQPSFENNSDISLNRKNYNYLIDVMGFHDSVKDFNEENCTINPELNNYISSSQSKKKLDYIMFHVPKSLQNCIWLSNEKLDFIGRSALSDHLAWTADINFNYH